MTARNISLRMDDEKIDRIDRLASELGRSRAWVLNQATDRFLEYEEWFVQQVRDGIADADAGNTIPHDQVMAEMRRKIGEAR
jgi:predicted transcriptional regulator